MSAETGLLFPYMQNFSPDFLQLEEYCRNTNALMSNFIPTSTISDYDLGGEGDLFKAPEPIIEGTVLGLDPMTATISVISCDEEVIAPQGLKVSDIESIQNEHLLSEVFYECRKDLMEKAAIDVPLTEVLDIKIPLINPGENQILENNVVPDVPLPKSISSGCLSSRVWVNGASVQPTFPEFSALDFGAAYGMRRAFSEGDIKTLGNGDVNLVHSPLDQLLIIGNCNTEDRREKLSRYRNKKMKRNFGRKIKYACRKALADSQPRIRGRFAKTEESDVFKRQ